MGQNRPDVNIIGPTLALLWHTQRITSLSTPLKNTLLTLHTLSRLCVLVNVLSVNKGVCKGDHLTHIFRLSIFYTKPHHISTAMSSNHYHWNENVINFDDIFVTGCNENESAVSDKNFIKMTKFPFQWSWARNQCPDIYFIWSIVLILGGCPN